VPVEKLDRLATDWQHGAETRRQRSAFIAATIRHALEDQRRWDDIEAALGSLQKSEHDWDADPAGWVRSQRRGDRRRVG
jgi:hypothetical protein